MGTFAARTSHVCFGHWPVDPAVLDTRLPHALSVATREGTGWVSVLGMWTRVLAGPLALPLAFPQVTIRTYARAGETEGVYFLRVDTDSRLASFGARRLFGVPFRRVPTSVTVDDDEVEIRTRSPVGRPLYVAAFPRTDAVEPVASDSLVGWLTDRTTYVLPDGRTGEVEHDPWAVGQVDAHLLRNELLDSEGLPEPDGDPLFRYSPGADVRLTSWPSSG